MAAQYAPIPMGCLLRASTAQRMGSPVRVTEKRGMGMGSNRGNPAIFDLSGRIAIVTGGSRGIGRAIACGYAQAGARVVVASRNLDACQEVVDGIQSEGGEGLAVQARVGDLDDQVALVETTVAHFGGLDVLVNNAAILRPHVIEKLTPEEFDELFAVNVRGPVFLSRMALPHLEASKRGVIIHVTAAGGHNPMAGIGAYGATKAAMLNWTRVMAQEWAPRGVRVHALTPGPVATDMILPRDANRREEFVRDLSGETLLGRVADPEELVGPAIFLASDASSFMTGQALIVDGGLMA